MSRNPAAKAEADTTTVSTFIHPTMHARYAVRMDAEGHIIEATGPLSVGKFDAAELARLLAFNPDSRGIGMWLEAARPKNTWYPQWPEACKDCGEDSSFTLASPTLGNGAEMWQCGFCGGITAGTMLAR